MTRDATGRLIVPMSNTYIGYEPREAPALPAELLIRRTARMLGSPWDLGQYRQIHMPVAVGQATADWNAPDLPSVLDLAIKHPGTEIRVPFEVYQVMDVVTRCVDVARAINPGFDEAYVYLTTDQRRVAPGETQRVGGWHVDGAQGPRYNPKLPICSAFLVCDHEPTEFALQPFDFSHIDMGRDNLFHEMDRQAADTAVYRPPTNRITFSTAYSVHRSPTIQAAGLRTLVRVDVSHKRYDRLGNTRNPALPDHDWDWQPRPIPPNLR